MDNSDITSHTDSDSESEYVDLDDDCYACRWEPSKVEGLCRDCERLVKERLVKAIADQHLCPDLNVKLQDYVKDINEIIYEQMYHSLCK